MSLTSREKKLLLFLVCFMIIGIGYMFMIKPQALKFEENKNKLENAKQLEFETDTVKKTYEELEKNIDLIYAQARKEGEVFYDVMPNLDIEKIVTDIFKAYGLRYPSIEITSCRSVPIEVYSPSEDGDNSNSDNNNNNKKAQSTNTKSTSSSGAAGTNKSNSDSNETTVTATKATVTIGFSGTFEQVMEALQYISEGPMKIHVPSCSFEFIGDEIGTVEGSMTIDIYCQNRI